jgi:hypothetical protein
MHFGVESAFRKRTRKKDSSFSEEKEAKRLFSVGGSRSLVRVS